MIKEIKKNLKETKKLIKLLFDVAYTILYAIDSLSYVKPFTYCALCPVPVVQLNLTIDCCGKAPIVCQSLVKTELLSFFSYSKQFPKIYPIFHVLINVNNKDLFLLGKY